MQIWDYVISYIIWSDKLSKNWQINEESSMYGENKEVNLSSKENKQNSFHLWDLILKFHAKWEVGHTWVLWVSYTQ